MQQPLTDPISERAYQSLRKEADDFYVLTENARAKILSPEDMSSEANRAIFDVIDETMTRVINLIRELQTKKDDLAKFAGHGLLNALGGADGSLFYLTDETKQDQDFLFENTKNLWASVFMTTSLLRALEYWYDQDEFVAKPIFVNELFEGRLLYALQNNFGDDFFQNRLVVPSEISQEMVKVHQWTVNSLLFNMCKNARQWLATKMKIDIAKKEDFIEIQLADNGPGIDEKFGQHIFEKGFSGRKSTGLGLALADERMAAMGGQISYESHGGLPTSEEIKKLDGQKGAVFFIKMRRETM